MDRTEAIRVLKGALRTLKLQASDRDKVKAYRELNRKAEKVTKQMPDHFCLLLMNKCQTAIEVAIKELEETATGGTENL